MAQIPNKENLSKTCLILEFHFLAVSTRIVRSSTPSGESLSYGEVSWRREDMKIITGQGRIASCQSLELE